MKRKNKNKEHWIEIETTVEDIEQKIFNALNFLFDVDDLFTTEDVEENEKL